MRYTGAVPRLLQILLLSAAFVLPGWQSEASNNEGLFRAVGNGGHSCGTWIENRKSFENSKDMKDLIGHAQDLSWVSGFVTAYNDYVWKGANVASETDGNGMTAWIDSYCAANPTKTIGNAAVALTTFLSSCPHPNDK